VGEVEHEGVEVLVVGVAPDEAARARAAFEPDARRDLERARGRLILDGQRVAIGRARGGVHERAGAALATHAPAPGVGLAHGRQHEASRAPVRRITIEGVDAARVGGRRGGQGDPQRSHDPGRHVHETTVGMRVVILSRGR
jgi:hypothetical protein